MTNLVIADFKTGYENGKSQFLLNNDAFPVLNNAFIFRNAIIRKRGNKQLARLQREVTVTDVTDGNGDFSGNLITLGSLEADASIVLNSITATVTGAPDQVFTEPATADGTLSNGASGTGTINYATGAITLDTDPNLAAAVISITFDYYPNLPVMGLEDYDENNDDFPLLVAFDTKYSYEINQSTETFYDVNFYHTTGEPFVWSGEDYQQFFSANYKDVMFVTNNKPGFHFKAIESTTLGDPTTVTITGHGLETGDWVFFNEFTTTGATELNLQSVQVTVTGNDTFTVGIATTANTTNEGMIQLLTRSLNDISDGIRYYTGDPTASTNGWVNFSPPLSNSSTPEYLVGAKIILPFKDRTLFFGVHKRTRAGAVNFYPNLMVYCQNGTPFYANPVPTLQTVQGNAWFANVAAKGGFLEAPVDQQVLTAVDAEDVVLCGYGGSKRKLIYTGDDSFPFFYQTINDELGSSSTFSAIPLDEGVIDIGPYGITLTKSTASQRVDLQIPDEIFQISPLDNGDERVTAFRDFRNEFVYFTYVPKGRGSLNNATFPNRTLLFNYRENNWATLDENYTHYGFYRKNSGYTWATLPFRTWSSWTTPWNFGGQDQRYPNVIGGNQQGFVMVSDTGSSNDQSQYVSNISSTTITSPDHCLFEGEFIQFSDPLNSDSPIHGQIEQIISITDSDNFVIETPYAGTFIGGVTYRRIQNFEIKTKMFPQSWGSAKKTRVSVQRFLCDNSPSGEMIVNLFADQTLNLDSNSPLISDFHVYTNILDLGPNPLYPNEENSSRLWHRMNNSIIGDTVQIGLTMSEDQLRDANIADAEVAIHAIILTLHPAGFI